MNKEKEGGRKKREYIKLWWFLSFIVDGIFL